MLLFVALSMESPAYFPLLCKKALRAALSLHKKQPEAELACSRHEKTISFSSRSRFGQSVPDSAAFLCPRFCRCVHSLIKLSLPGGVCEVEANVLEELWDYYEEALSIISAAVSQHQSRAAIPWPPPPVPSNRTSPCCIINPLSSTPFLPACCSTSFFFYQWAFSSTSISRCFHSPPPSCQFEC